MKIKELQNINIELKKLQKINSYSNFSLEQLKKISVGFETHKKEVLNDFNEIKIKYNLLSETLNLIEMEMSLIQRYIELKIKNGNN